MAVVKKGSKNAKEVSRIKKLLVLVNGAKLDDTGKNKGVFGVKMEAAVKAFQKKNGLVVDGQVGTMTMARLAFLAEGFDKVKTPPLPKPQAPTEIGEKPFWVAQMESRLGWTEFTHDKQIAKDWWMAGLSQYKSVIGKRNAWCGLACEIALRSGGLKGPARSAAAASWSNFGEECDSICGAFAPIRHKGGGRHIGVFLFWFDEKKRIAAILGGNQSQAYSIAKMNLSGNKAGHDEIVGGFRFPKGYAKTGYVYTKRGGEKAAGSTR